MHDLRELSLHSNTLGLMAKGLLTYDSKDQFADAARDSVQYRHVADVIQKGVFSTDDVGPLVNWSSEGASFLDTTHASLMDGVRGYRLAPTDTRILVSDGVVVGIIGERERLPVSGNVKIFQLTHKKTGGLHVFSKEQVLSSSSEAESFVTRSLRETVAGCSNKAFIDSLLLSDSNSLEQASLGESATLINATIAAAMAELDLKLTSSLVLVVDVHTCANLASKTTAAGELAFPNCHAILGGELSTGVRVFPVDASQLPDEDSDGRFCVLFDADSILINRGTVSLARSEEGSLELATDPDGNNPVVSLFQSDAVALRVVRTFALDQIRNGVCQISGVSW